MTTSVFPESLGRMQLQRRPTTVPARSELDHTSGWGHTNDPNTTSSRAYELV